MSVICIHHKGTDPYFNLAAEEYLLKNFDEDIFMLWQGEPSIVVGKHQNALAEINHRFIKENRIKVARRISGGGTVFHDPGNLNFTFIKKVDQIDQVNFKIFTQPVVAVLKKLGIDAHTSGRNDLLINGKKISGNAEHVYKKRVLHHGTLLFNSELSHLKKALKVDLSRFTDKAVQSNRSVVTNIADYLKEPISVEEFGNFIYQEIAMQFDDAKDYYFSETDLEEILKLREEKYSQWDWIYGYSPKYSYTNELENSDKKIQFTLEVRKGLIQQSDWKDAISQETADLLQQTLLGCRHDLEAISEEIKKIEAQLKAAKFPIDELLEKIV